MSYSHFFFFFFTDTATTEIYTLSLHDALPISGINIQPAIAIYIGHNYAGMPLVFTGDAGLSSDILKLKIAFVKVRSEEHTSELQSQSNLVCRLLLEKKKKNNY